MASEEDEIYDAFEHANRVKFGTITGKKVIDAVKTNNIEEVKRLMNLSVDEGGLLILRIIQTDENGKTAKEIAEEMNYTEILKFLITHN